MILAVQALVTVATVTASLIGPAGATTQALPSTPARTATIEDYPAYEGQTVCSPTVKPGVAAFRRLVLNAYPSTRSLGVVRACNIGGVSEHKEGRALDWGVNVRNPIERAYAEEFLAWLQATDGDGNPHARARRLGIQYIIWNRRIWGAYRADEGWRPYHGPSAHTDHVHFSFTWAGASRKTTWWTNRIRPLTVSGRITGRTSTRAAVIYGSPVTVTGRVGRSDGGPATVTLQLRTAGGGIRTLATTHALRRFTVSAPLRQSGRLVVLVQATSCGPVKQLQVGDYRARVKIVGWTRRGESKAGEAVTLTVQAVRGAGRTVRLQRRTQHRWVTITRVTAGAKGVAQLQTTFSSARRYRLRVVVSGDARMLRAATGVRIQTVQTVR